MTVPAPDVGGFQRGYEEAAPNVPNEKMVARLRLGAPLAEMVELIEANAPRRGSTIAITRTRCAQRSRSGRVDLSDARRVSPTRCACAPIPAVVP
jgi:hypothetical protein